MGRGRLASYYQFSTWRNSKRLTDKTKATKATSLIGHWKIYLKKICKKHRKKLCRNSCAWYTLRQKWNLFQPIRSTLSSDTSLVRLSWYEISTLVSQTLFRGGTSSGVEKRRPFSGQQTINMLSIHCVFWEYFLTSQYITVIAPCFRRCYKTYSFKKSGAVEKSNNWNCLPNEFLRCVCVCMYVCIINI